MILFYRFFSLFPFYTSYGSCRRALSYQLLPPFPVDPSSAFPTSTSTHGVEFLWGAPLSKRKRGGTTLQPLSSAQSQLRRVPRLPPPLSLLPPPSSLLPPPSLLPPLPPFLPPPPFSPSSQPSLFLEFLLGPVLPGAWRPGERPFTGPQPPRGKEGHLKVITETEEPDWDDCLVILLRDLRPGICLQSPACRDGQSL